MQWVAFVGLGCLCMYFLIALAVSLRSFFTNKETLAIIAQSRDWHTLTLLGIAIVVFAIVPLSIALALVKMVSSSDNQGDKKEEIALTTPQLELFKLIVETAKAVKGG
jgi:hypothetical protein